MNRSFEFKEGGSSKFWRIETKGKSFTVTFGRIGTAGQTQLKSFANHRRHRHRAPLLRSEEIIHHALAGWPNDLQGAVMTSTTSVALVQLDASMTAPKGIKKVFDYWGQGLVHFIIAGDALKKRQLTEASAMLAYT